MVDGCIPSDMATRTPEEIEEERRLLYVAMTRAKDELDLIVPQRFYTYQQSKTGDRHVYACRSRFIPDGIIRLVRLPGLARACAGLEPDRKENRCDHGCCSEPAPDVALGSYRDDLTDKEKPLSLSVTFCQAPPDRGRPTRRPGPMA